MEISHYINPVSLHRVSLETNQDSKTILNTSSIEMGISGFD